MATTEYTPQQRDRMSRQAFEAAVLVEFANTGQKKAFPDMKMYQSCGPELAMIALAIQAIRDKGFGKDVEPNTFTN